MQMKVIWSGLGLRLRNFLSRVSLRPRTCRAKTFQFFDLSNFFSFARAQVPPPDSHPLWLSPPRQQWEWKLIAEFIGCSGEIGKLSLRLSFPICLRREQWASRRVPSTLADPLLAGLDRSTQRTHFSTRERWGGKSLLSSRANRFILFSLFISRNVTLSNWSEVERRTKTNHETFYRFQISENVDGFSSCFTATNSTARIGELSHVAQNFSPTRDKNCFLSSFLIRFAPGGRQSCVEEMSDTQAWKPRKSFFVSLAARQPTSQPRKSI